MIKLNSNQWSVWKVFSLMAILKLDPKLKTRLARNWSCRNIGIRIIARNNVHSIVCRKPNRIGSSQEYNPIYITWSLKTTAVFLFSLSFSFSFLLSFFFATVQFNWMSLLLPALLSARFVHRFILTSRGWTLAPTRVCPCLSAPSSLPPLSIPRRSLLLGRYRRWLDPCPALPADPIRSDPIFIVSGRAEPPHSSRMRRP